MKRRVLPIPQRSWGHLLPVAPRNWADLKKTIPGLVVEAQRPIKLVFSTADIKIFEIAANSEDSMQKLSENGLRLLTIQEVLFSITHDTEFVNKLKGKSFHVDGVCPFTDGFYTIQKGLTLIEGKSKNPEKGVFCVSGNGPLRFFVDSDDDAGDLSRRFQMRADPRPDDVALVSIGVSWDTPTMSIYEALRRRT